MKMGQLLLGSALALAVPHAASAAITWTDWQQAGANTVTGVAGGVGVTYSGAYQFANTNGGIAYWDSPNWDGTAGRPSGSDIIALSQSGTKTITFSSAVEDVYLAIMSWNGQSNVVFDRAFTQEGWVQGCGYWGCGVLTNVTPISFTSTGESHGILKFAGPITSLTITDSNFENWHGIQVGINAVPEPSTWAMLILGFGAVGGAMRLRRRASLALA
ncbi:MAG TPA: PEPxxWA-CTERM sorting domain-containing protein [Qipengyuania sp.]|nr:PEPxxWA-CTERM sorting domain-containing protein [Qipengyuania sp.]